MSWRDQQEYFKAFGKVDEREFLNLPGYGSIALMRLSMDGLENSLMLGDCSRQISLEFGMYGDTADRQNTLHKVTRLIAQFIRLKKRLEQINKAYEKWEASQRESNTDCPPPEEEALWIAPPSTITEVNPEQSTITVTTTPTRQRPRARRRSRQVRG